MKPKSTQPTLTQLRPGDIRQRGDLIQESTSCVLLTTPPESHEVFWKDPRPVAAHTIGRAILPADLITAKFFRP